MPEVGEAGQLRLRAATVTIVGAGGLGSPVAMYLAAAGVGALRIVDDDVVDVSNLQRQLLHTDAGIGSPKVESAAQRLAQVNPHVHVDARRERLAPANARALLGSCDVVVDGSDNLDARYAISDACVALGIPLVHASLHRFHGQATVLATHDAPCYRCLFPVPPPPETVPGCAEAGVLGVLPGLLGSIQATEALKLLLGVGTPLRGRLLLVDALAMTFRTVQVGRDPGCRTCGERATRAPALPARHPEAVPELTPRELASRWTAEESLILLDVREPHEWARDRIPGARLLPLGTVREALPSLPRDVDIVVHCAVGVRSAAAVRMLRDAGFTRVWNLAGGIARWRAEVEPG